MIGTSAKDEMGYKTKCLIPLLIMFFCADCLGQIKEPGASGCGYYETTPELMAAGEVSRSDRHEFGITLNRDCSELFIGIEHGTWVSIEHYERTETGWLHIGRLLGSEAASTNDPALSLDGKRLYFILKRDGQADIAYIDRLGVSTWGELQVLPEPVNSASNEYYSSFNRDGDLIFASNRNSAHPGNYNIYRAMFGASEQVEVVAFPKGINLRGYEADPFIAPDDDYLLFASTRPGGKGMGDIFVSFNLGEDAWSPPQALTTINTSGHELCPYVTNDGKTLYYTSNQDIYRVSASIVETLRPD